MKFIASPFTTPLPCEQASGTERSATFSRVMVSPTPNSSAATTTWVSVQFARACRSAANIEAE